jgi:hypothetical protein
MGIGARIDGGVLRRLRVAGGVVTVAGIACAVQATVGATWLRMHYTPKDPLYAVDRFAAEDTLPRKLSDLSERGWVYAALTLLVALAFAAASKSAAVRRAAAALALPALALAVLVVLDAQGTVHWGSDALTRWDDDRFLVASTASGATWALAAAALLALGTLLLALTPAERRGPSDDLQLQQISGYAG